MSKQALIDRMAEAANISKAAATRALEAMLEGISEALCVGDGLSLVGFGSFVKSVRAARSGHNPQTGAKLDIPASIGARFKPGKKLKDALNASR
ncbi:MAG: DNA-binding protein HU [Gammaproteobacteria bacterium RIFCSPHIGHO2_12_FULL_45_9]|nr:MAG: DNA-binding protein HU [Gammaproteobacteria bacterium RIFCSPHIGHO2_12_FULL_45_9]